MKYLLFATFCLSSALSLALPERPARVPFTRRGTPRAALVLVNPVEIKLTQDKSTKEHLSKKQHKSRGKRH